MLISMEKKRSIQFDHHHERGLNARTTIRIGLQCKHGVAENENTLDIDPIHKWRLLYFCSVIVQISLLSLTLEQEFFSN